MTEVCIAIGAWGLGLFTAFFLYGWLDERSDRYAGIPWKESLDTCINWDLAAHRRR